MSVSQVHGHMPHSPHTVNNQPRSKKSDSASSGRSSAKASSFEQELSTVSADGKRKGTPNQRQANTGTEAQAGSRKVDLSA
jgi:hypothetical protein